MYCSRGLLLIQAIEIEDDYGFLWMRVHSSKFKQLGDIINLNPKLNALLKNKLGLGFDKMSCSCGIK